MHNTKSRALKAAPNCRALTRGPALQLGQQKGSYRLSTAAVAEGAAAVAEEGDWGNRTMPPQGDPVAVGEPVAEGTLSAGHKEKRASPTATK